MSSTVAPDPVWGSAPALLTEVRGARATRDAAEVHLLRSVVDWSVPHQVSRDADAAWAAGFGDTGLALGGPGCPLVRESAVTELAAALGTSTAGGAAFVGQGLELRYRLPRLWERVLAGVCPVWRARRVASATQVLCEDGADFVDTHVARFAHAVSLAQLDRLVEEALVRFDPQQAAERRRSRAEGRHVHVGLDRAGAEGVVELHGGLDLADALDLEAALAGGARELGRLGCPESLAVRRSLALGELARGQATLDTEATDQVTDGSAEEAAGRASTRRAGRQVVLHVHLARAAVTGRCDCGCECRPDPDEVGLARLDARHGVRGPLSAEQVRAWCATAARITIRPVLDLAEAIHCESYEATQRLRDQTAERDVTCVFPHCTRPAARCDDEHPVPWPQGPTASHNQAPVCRRHHRAKTHHGWGYVVLTPGLYLWTSPAGLRYLRSHAGTHEIDPAPPGAPPDPLPGQPPRPGRPPRLRVLDQPREGPAPGGPPRAGPAPPDDPAPF